MVKILADDLHVLTGSYALDALPGPERAEFERHLQHCPSCDAEVRGLRETAARLAMARALPSPPGMEQRVLAAAYWTRQLPPLPGDRLRAAREHRRARVARRFAGRAIRIPRRAARIPRAERPGSPGGRPGSPGGRSPSPRPPAWPPPSPSASPSCPLSISSSRRGRAAPRSPGWSRPATPVSRRPGRERAAVSPSSPRRPAGGRRRRHRDGVPAGRAGLPGVGDRVRPAPVRRA